MSTKNLEIVLFFFQRNLSPITSISQSRSVLHTFVLVRLKYNKTQPIKKNQKLGVMASTLKYHVVT